MSEVIVNRPMERFGIVPAWIVEYAGEVGGNGVAVFTVLCIHANKASRCWPSIATIARESGTSKSSVKRAIKSLFGAGLIKLIEQGDRRGRANIYEIVDKSEIKGSTVDPLVDKRGSHRHPFQEKGSTVNLPRSTVNLPVVHSEPPTTPLTTPLTTGEIFSVESTPTVDNSDDAPELVLEKFRADCKKAIRGK